MTKYNVYLNDRFMHQSTVESYLPAKDKLIAAVRYSSSLAETAGRNGSVVRESSRFITDGVITLIECFD